jgi:hypothetical protein
MTLQLEWSYSVVSISMFIDGNQLPEQRICLVLLFTDSVLIAEK